MWKNDLEYDSGFDIHGLASRIPPIQINQSILGAIEKTTLAIFIAIEAFDAFDGGAPPRARRDGKTTGANYPGWAEAFPSHRTDVSGLDLCVYTNTDRRILNSIMLGTSNQDNFIPESH
ncbi:hypothetical protein F441_11497 [Phytophthora nicotianae CJ01A1]|uniref:Uncharacterized protein n=1 Tax=Phytophthora nicotianae CJ01A1 TaxID=1317063 RepID=W2WRZ1_PHYNI|nr:hypothetical protein F441_11497 [Phytophthora nicotianae CJ01A1]